MDHERLISVALDDLNPHVIFYVDDYGLDGKCGYREMRIQGNYSDVDGNGLRARLVDRGTRVVVTKYYRGQVVWELNVRSDEEVRRLPSTLCEMHRLFPRNLSRAGRQSGAINIQPEVKRFRGSQLN